MAVDFSWPNATRHYTIPETAALAIPAGNWSFGFWLRMEINTGTSYAYLLSANVASTGINSQFLWHIGEDAVGGSDTNAFICQAQDADGTAIQFPSPIATYINNSPFLLVVQKNGTTFQVYACPEDGTAILIGSSVLAGFGGFLPPGAWYVGARSNLETTRFYGEHLGELWFANRALSLGEVTTLGSGTEPNVTLGANLLGWWQFTSATSTTIPNEIGTPAATRVGTGWATSAHFPTRTISGVSGVVDATLPAVMGDATGIVTTPGVTQTFYVATVAGGGSNTNNGSSGSPWATLAFADSQIGPGDTVIVRSGTYQGNNLTLTTSGTSSARVTWRSEVKHGAILTPAASQTGDAVLLIRADYVDIDGFQIDGTANQNCNAGIEQGQSHSRTYNCLIHHVRALGGETGQGGAGIGLSGFWGPTGDYTGTDHEAFNNTIHHIGAYPTPGEFTHGIYPACPTGKVYNNLIYAIEASGIHLWHNARTYEITNNTIFECGDAGILAAADVSIGSLIDTKVSNNIVIGCETGLIQEGAIGTGNEYRNNTLFSCDTAVSGATPISGTLTSDPGLVNYQANGTGDYHLAAGSLSIDSGLATWAPATDFDGIARPQGGLFDRGAYEFVSGSSGTASATLQAVTASAAGTVTISGVAGSGVATLAVATASAVGVSAGGGVPSESGLKLGQVEIGAIEVGPSGINRIYVGTSLFWSE